MSIEVANESGVEVDEQALVRVARHVLDRLGVSPRTYVLATLIGIVPGSFVYASVGAGLGSVFARGGTFSAAGVLTPQVVTALAGLALLALVPVAYKRFKAR